MKDKHPISSEYNIYQSRSDRLCVCNSVNPGSYIHKDCLSGCGKPVKSIKCVINTIFEGGI